MCKEDMVTRIASRQRKYIKKSLNVVLNDYLSPYHICLEKVKRPTMYVSRMKSIGLEVLQCLHKCSYMRMICIFACVFTCMHACVYSCVYTLIGVYAWMYMCPSMFLILICVCILSSFHPHNHLSPNSPRLMLLFVDFATVNKVYLISSYLKNKVYLILWIFCLLWVFSIQTIYIVLYS